MLTGGRLYLAPIGKPQRVLDLGTGTGKSDKRHLHFSKILSCRLQASGQLTLRSESASPNGRATARLTARSEHPDAFVIGTLLNRQE